MEYFDGSRTKGPYTFSGPIGKQLENCEQRDIVQFRAIESIIPEVNCNGLSADQQYLLDMCKAINAGHCSRDLEKKLPGKLSHARWLTTANRILRLYISTENPSEELLLLTEYTLKVYARVWFSIKMKPSCKYGGLHVLELVHFSRYLDGSIKKILDPVIQRNAYFAHPDNLLLCMVSDE